MKYSGENKLKNVLDQEEFHHAENKIGADVLMIEILDVIKRLETLTLTISNLQWYSLRKVQLQGDVQVDKKSRKILIQSKEFPSSQFQLTSMDF